MNVIDGLKYRALIVCMRSGMRYNECMHYVLHTKGGFNVPITYTHTAEEYLEVMDFVREFEAEYKIYRAKMDAAGLE